MSTRTTIYNRLHAWAEAGWSGTVVFGWAVLQGIFAPGPAELFFLPLGAANQERVYRLAFLSATGSVCGALTLYAIALNSMSWISGPLTGYFDMSPDAVASMTGMLAKWGALGVFASVFIPISTKLTVIMAGVVRVAPLHFALAIFAARFMRTFFLAYLIRNGGAALFRRWTLRS
jgi:membrane protein YqaA with SNARE-associated domain